MPAVAESAASSLPGTDEFIERCERIRAWNYVVRAAAQAALAPPMEAAGTATFGSAQVWFTGTRARVHLLNETSLDELEAIEDWLAERELTAMFDVLPVIACRPVARVLGERGYRLVAWQPTLYRHLSTAIGAAAATPRVERERVSAVEVEEVEGESAEFRNTFMAGLRDPGAGLGERGADHGRSLAGGGRAALPGAVARRGRCGGDVGGARRHRTAGKLCDVAR